MTRATEEAANGTAAAHATSGAELRTICVSPWCRARFGHAGVFALAAIVGVTDIDPFVLSIAQGSVREMPLPITMAAILVAASTNDLLKALYAVMLALTLLAASGWLRRAGWPQACADRLG
jgi:uncharacterized membrane protein (DUF4010 family)